MKIENCIVRITGKLQRLKNGDVIVARRGKSGSVHSYQMHFARVSRTIGQVEHISRFRKACIEADRQLKVCKVRWEVSYKACGGVFRGKKYVTLRGYVVASCYQMVDEASKNH